MWRWLRKEKNEKKQIFDQIKGMCMPLFLKFLPFSHDLRMGSIRMVEIMLQIGCKIEEKIQ